MLYTLNPFAKGGARFLSVLFFTLFLFSSPLLPAQSPPANGWFTPEEFDSEDELTLHVEYGTMANPVPAALEISLTFAYEGFDITSVPYADLTDSWFCEDGNCDGAIEVNHSTREIKFTVTRTDGQAVAGFGMLGKGKVIIVEMDDVQMKNEPKIIQLVSKEVHFDIEPLIDIHYSSLANRLKLKGVEAQQLTKISVLGINGQVLFQRQNALELETNLYLPRQNLYIIKVETTTGVWLKKLWVE